MAAVILAIGVGLGAFAAHGLKSKLAPEQLNTFEIGVRYQMYHGLAILILALSPLKKYNFRGPIRALALGILLFSGSLYLLATREILGLGGVQIFGPMTPIGGIFFIIGWLWVLLVVIKK